MAILSGKIYHKIHLNNVSIKDGNIVIRIDYYETQEDRDIEKTNEQPINNFVTKAKEFVDQLQNEFYELLKSYEIDPTIDVNDEKFNEILENNTEIAEKYKAGVSIGIDFDMLVSKLILGNSIVFTPINIDKWKELGFQESWIEESHTKLGTMEIDLCDYSGQNITPEFLYTTLKTKINNAVDC